MAQPEGSPAPGDPDEAADDCVAGGPSGGTGTQAGAADPAVPPLEILSAVPAASLPVTPFRAT